MTENPYTALGQRICDDLSNDTESTRQTLKEYAESFEQVDRCQPLVLGDTITLAELIGMMFCLLVKSEYHRQFTLDFYMNREILPALDYQQFKIYLNDANHPKAFVTWAWLSDSVLAHAHKTGAALNPDVWQSGKNLFFNDWVAPYGDVRVLIKDLTDNIFPDEVATSVRHDQNRKLTKVCKWYGKNRKKH